MQASWKEIWDLTLDFKHLVSSRCQPGVMDFVSEKVQQQVNNTEGIFFFCLSVQVVFSFTTIFISCFLTGNDTCSLYKFLLVFLLDLHFYCCLLQFKQ